MKEKHLLILGVWLLFSIAGVADCGQPSEASVEILRFTFQPSSITVSAGTTIIWTNLDPVVHTVTADDGSFDSGSIASNDGRFERTFAEPGRYQYHCTFHPTMKGEVVITGTESSDPPAGGPQVGLEPVASGFAAPIEFVSAQDGTGRMFLVDQTGLVKIVKSDGTVLDEPFLDLRDRMVGLNSGYDERGLLGLAFHPGFSENGRAFAFYSAPLRPGAPKGWSCTNHLSEFTVFADDPNKADVNSEKVLLVVDKPQLNHNGGTITFGPDGYLYVPLGDGGGANDAGAGHAASGNGQDTGSILGKILRIDVDNVSRDKPYGIPADNPFVGQEGVLPEIYALGFRNPWRITFDTKGDRSLFVSDAGQNLWEEVDQVAKGGNYGWNIREGTHCFDPGNPNESPQSCPDVDSRGLKLSDPVIEYGHDRGSVVVGGYMYRGKALPEFAGKYIFGDWSNGFSRGNGTLLLATPSSEGLWHLEEIGIAGYAGGRVGSFIRSFGMDDQGEIYVLTSDQAGPTGTTGKILKLVPA